MANVLVPGYLKWDGQKYITDPLPIGPRGVPGPIGPAGANGTNGTSGTHGAAGGNAYSITTVSYLQPEIFDPVTITVNSTAWIIEQLVVAIDNAGVYQVTSVIDTTHVTLILISDLISPGDTVNSGTLIAPTGTPGEDGNNGTDGTSPSSDVNGFFSQPNVSSNATVPVNDSSWMVVGETVYLDSANCNYLVVSVAESSVVLTNLGYAASGSPEPPMTGIVTGKIVPTGVRGPAGAAGAAGATGATGATGPAGAVGSFSLIQAAISSGAACFTNGFGPDTHGCEVFCNADFVATGLRVYHIYSGSGTDSLTPQLWTGAVKTRSGSAVAITSGTGAIYELPFTTPYTIPALTKVSLSLWGHSSAAGGNCWTRASNTTLAWGIAPTSAATLVMGFPHGLWTITRFGYAGGGDVNPISGSDMWNGSALFLGIELY